VGESTPLNLEQYIQHLREQTSVRNHLRTIMEALLVTPSSAQDWEEFKARHNAHHQHKRRRVEDYLHRRATLAGLPFQQFALDLGLALEIALEHGMEAVEYKLVRNVAGVLEMMVKNRQLSRSFRLYARELLDILLSRIKPAIESQSSWDAPTVDAWARRQRLLAAYEQEHSKLKGIMKESYRNPNARFLKLREAYPREEYPGIPDDDLHTWTPRKCARIAHKLVGDRVSLTAETTRKYLQQSRKERERLAPLPPYITACLRDLFRQACNECNQRTAQASDSDDT
jgi:hypothetical protein